MHVRYIIGNSARKSATKISRIWANNVVQMLAKLAGRLGDLSFVKCGPIKKYSAVMHAGSYCSTIYRRWYDTG